MKGFKIEGDSKIGDKEIKKKEEQNVVIIEIKGVVEKEIEMKKNDNLLKRVMSLKVKGVLKVVKREGLKKEVVKKEVKKENVKKVVESNKGQGKVFKDKVKVVLEEKKVSIVSLVKKVVKQSVYSIFFEIKSRKVRELLNNFSEKSSQRQINDGVKGNRRGSVEVKSKLIQKKFII